MLRQLNRVPVSTCLWAKLACNCSIRHPNLLRCFVTSSAAAPRLHREIARVFPCIAAQAQPVRQVNRHPVADMPSSDSDLSGAKFDTSRSDLLHTLTTSVVRSTGYVLSSPIAKLSGLQQGDVDLDRWQNLGELMSKRLKQPSFEDASEQQRHGLSRSPSRLLERGKYAMLAGHVCTSTTFPYICGCIVIYSSIGKAIQTHPFLLA